MTSKIKFLFFFSFGISLGCFRSDVPNVLEASYQFSFRYKGVGYISYLDAQDNKKIICTGTMIDPYTVLTCSHAHLNNSNKYKTVFFNLPEINIDDKKVDSVEEMQFTWGWVGFDITLLKFKNPLVDNYSFQKINFNKLQLGKKYESYSVGYGNAKILGKDEISSHNRHAIYHDISFQPIIKHFDLPNGSFEGKSENMLCSDHSVNTDLQPDLKNIMSGLSFKNDKKNDLEGLTVSTDSGGPLFYNDEIIGTLIGSIRSFKYQDVFQDLSNPLIKHFIESNRGILKEKTETSIESFTMPQENINDVFKKYKRKFIKKRKNKY